jgi:hypothetical protein
MNSELSGIRTSESNSARDHELVFASPHLPRSGSTRQGPEAARNGRVINVKCEIGDISFSLLSPLLLLLRLMTT